MKIEPLRRYVKRPVALLEPGHRRLTVTTMDGTWTSTGSRDVAALLASLEGYVCYAGAGLARFRHTTQATSWTLSAWRGRETRIRHEPTGVEVSSLRGTLEDSEDPFSDLCRVLDWLRGYGVGPGSVSGMAWNLWRASLASEVAIGFDPDIGRAALYGGRQEAREARTYQQMVAADIRAAYPHAMASAHPYACSLRPVSVETALDPSVSGLAEATVHIDADMPYSPLPVRIAPQLIQFQWGTVRGVWPWVELAAAEAVGATVVVHRSWAPRRTADLFAAWWPMATEGRALPGAASTLAKAISNSLWGQFGMVGDDRTTTLWADPAGNVPYTVEAEGRNLPHAWCAHVAAETTARVRSRMTTEGLYGSTFSPVHVDTDGIIIRSTAECPAPCGEGLGQWRIKEQMKKVDIRAPQLYRYTCGRGCGVSHAKWHYVASGMTAAQAPEFFRKEGHRGTKISYLATFDQVLSPAHADDPELTTLDGQMAREHRLWKAGV